MSTSTSLDADENNRDVAPKVAVIIVTFASHAVLNICLRALELQTRRPDTIVIVDNNSPSPSYLEDIQVGCELKIIRNLQNQGFCGGNNTGYRLVCDHTYVVFLNPDAFLQPDFIERSLLWMERRENIGTAMVTGTLLGFDLARHHPTGLIDSTGIFQSWYGKWYDRRQGEKWDASSFSNRPESIPAICGALMFCRTAALEGVLLRVGEVFDERFFMYKEDIDLSLRLTRHRWKLIYLPDLICLHCRGWQGRRRMSAYARYISARNELRVCARNRGNGLFFSLAKLVFVGVENACIGIFRSRSAMRNP